LKKFRSTVGFEGVCSAVRFGSVRFLTSVRAVEARTGEPLDSGGDCSAARLGSVRFLTSVLVVEAEEPLEGCGRGDKAALFA